MKDKTESSKSISICDEHHTTCQNLTTTNGCSDMDFNLCPYTIADRDKKICSGYC
jgi:hypothetical protein